MKILYLIIGFDFGTSCAKAVIQAPFLLGGKTWAIDFGTHGSSGNPYLLPAVVSIDRDECVRLGCSDGGSRFSASKEVLLLSPEGLVQPIEGSHSPIPAMYLAILFAALAIREIRDWFTRNHGAEFSEFTINWQLNMGVPSKGYDDVELHERFYRLAVAAWRLSEYSGGLPMSMAEASYARVTGDSDLPGTTVEDINIIPEVIAEFVGYAKSDQRRDGVRVIVDVGANTLDVCAFNICKKDGEDLYPFITAIVTTNGSLRLHEHRVERLGEVLADTRCLYNSVIDPMMPVPTEVRDYLTDDSYLALPDKDVDCEFRKECLLTFTQTIDALVRLSGGAPEWHGSGIPIFFCGGGSLLPFYHIRLFDDTNQFLKRHYGYRKPFVQREIPMPTKLAALGYNKYNFHRLAVAFGLSFPAKDVGKILAAPKIVKHETDRRFDIVEFYDSRYVPQEYC